MLRVVLTGGIGSGKTRVAQAFATLGAPLVDADVLARELVAPGQPAWQAILDRFGAEVRAADGGLDRRRLATLVFSDTRARLDLEAILHPPIARRLAQWRPERPFPYGILVIPLALETGLQRLGQRLLVVDLPEDAQSQRVMARDGLSAAQVRERLAAQCSREQRLAAADDVIDNSGSLAELDAQVGKLHKFYLNKEEP